MILFEQAAKMFETSPWKLIYEQKATFMLIVIVGCVLNSYLFYLRNEAREFEQFADIVNSYIDPIYDYWLPVLKKDTLFAIKKLRPNLAVYMKFFSISQVVQSFLITTVALFICFRHLGHLNYDRKDIIVGGLLSVVILCQQTLQEYKIGLISHYIDEVGFHPIKQTLLIQGFGILRTLLIINIINIIVNIVREK